MVVLQGYFDESGTHADSDSVVLAGFLSTFERWQQFEAEWNKSLAEYDLPFFHMTDFANQVGHYASWSEDMRRARLGRLLEIVHGHAMASYGVSLSKKVFEAAFTPSAKRVVGNPYSFAALHCFLLVGTDLRQLDGEAWATHILESGANGTGEILSAYDFLVKIDATELTRMVSLRFEDKRLFVPLQAADILAYEMYKEHSNQVGVRHQQQRYPFHLLYQMPHNWKFFGEQDIREFAVKVELLAQRVSR